MVWTISTKVNLNIQPTVSRIIATGIMTRQEHLQLSSVLLADQKITDEERRQINRAFDYLQTGRLKLVG
jgi:hypothetical protein